MKSIKLILISAALLSTYIATQTKIVLQNDTKSIVSIFVDGISSDLDPEATKQLSSFAKNVSAKYKTSLNIAFKKLNLDAELSKYGNNISEIAIVPLIPGKYYGIDVGEITVKKAW